MNKKKILIISVLVIIVLLGIYLLYNTFAINNTASTNNTYTINLSNSNNTIDVPSKSSKIVYYKINNTNDGIIKYGIDYKSSNIIVKAYEDSKDPETGLISSKDNKFVKLKLINNSTSNDTVTLNTVFGYENGGNLIVPSGNTLVTQKIKKINTIKNAESNVSATSNFLGTTLVRNTIESITITNDNIVPTTAIGSFDVSNNNDGSIMMWYTKGNSDNLYNVYIGSESGITTFPDDSKNLFAYLSNVTSIDLKFTNVTNTSSMIYMFYQDTNLKEINLSSFKTSSLLYFVSMFEGCSSLVTLDLSGFDTSRITNFSNLFKNCTSLKNIDLSSFNTSSALIFANMFMNCSSLQSIDLSNFNTSKVTSMIDMFYGCSSLKSLNLSNFDTSNVTAMSAMFYKCSLLTTLDLSRFNTSKVTDMSDMFNSCSALVNINLSSFNTSKVTNMYGMFYKCSSLITLDLSSFNTSKVTNMYRTFMLCTELTTIYVSDLWNTNKVTDSNQMFIESRKLKGSVSYDWSKTDVSMANYTNGYLTKK